MMKFLKSSQKRSKDLSSHKRSHRYRKQKLQFENLEHRIVFDGEGLRAVNDIYTTETGSVLRVDSEGVLANDISSPESPDAPWSSLLMRGPSHGTLTLDDQGSFVYTPEAGYQGVDGFLYRIRIGESTSNIASVTIYVEDSNRGPDAFQDQFQMNEDEVLDVGGAEGVLENDVDLDGDLLTATLVEEPLHGTLTLKPNGGFTYTPATNFHGTDRFVYSAGDGSLSEEATVTIEVAPSNDAPVASNDVYSIDEDTALIVELDGVLSNDSDIDLDPMQAILESGPEHGTLSLGADGKFVYRPTSHFHGIDSFTYRASDGSESSAIVVVEIVVRAVNDAPDAVNDRYSMDEDGVLEVTVEDGVLSNDRDIDGDQLVARIDVEPEHGELILGEDGRFTYRPDSDFSGLDAFTYRAFDGESASEVVVVEIQVQGVNDAPVASNDLYEIDEDGSLVIGGAGVLSNDSDVDRNTLSAWLDVGPEHGQLVLNPDGSFTYQPDANYHGTDAFSYRAFDGTQYSDVVAVQIDVRSVNDAPIGNDDFYSTPKGVKLVVAAPGILGNDSDVDNDQLSIVPGTPPSHGRLTLDSDGRFEYTPDPNFRGIDTFTYKTFDGLVESPLNIVRIQVGGENTRPIAINDRFRMTADSSLVVSLPQSLLQNDGDADGDQLIARLFRTTRHGQLSLSLDGSFSYTPNPGFVGTDSFLYRVHDGELSSYLAAVTIHVRPNASVPASIVMNGERLRASRIDHALGSIFDELALPAFADGILVR